MRLLALVLYFYGMNLKLVFGSLCLLLALVGPTQAQTKVLQFEDALCTYKGYYDSKKYTKKQLLDTYALFSDAHYVSDEGSLAEVRARYEAAIQGVKALQPVQTPYFKELQAATVRYLEETYALKQVEKTAKTAPEKLITAVKSGTKAHTYAVALNKGGNALLTAYESLVKEKMKNNAKPENLWREYQNNIRQANKLDLAFKEVLVYGWWNNANELVHHINYDGTQFKKFMQLFSKVDSDCDEP